MEFQKVVSERRSVRHYRPEAVSEEVLTKILDAGRLAPTAGNLQPWEFIVIRGAELKEQVVACTYPGADVNSPNCQSWINQAPVLVVVCIDATKSVAKYGSLGADVAVLDGAAAMQTMILAAVAYGLGSCWVSGYRTEELKEALAIPEHVQPLGILPLGYPASIPEARPKRQLSEIIHDEKYLLINKTET